ncbi:MAG TPA: 2Fe-2S iron-sulfur cluster-binding protein [Rectinemataceae bacterium]|nr:2Fe-2S iron-sulfur cluster-binding protein [Rectinemataceae bacterium]
MIIDLSVNGAVRHLQARSGDRLVDVLRNELSLSSLLPDCLSGKCGRCFVFMDGRLVLSCMIPAFKAKGSTILSYEAIEDDPDVEEIVLAMQKAQALPCAFCRKGKIMAITDLLARSPLPEEKEILKQLDMVACPCTDPESLVKAVGIAAEMRNKRKFNRADK